MFANHSSVHAGGIKKDKTYERNGQRRYPKDANGKTEEFSKAGSPPYLKYKAHSCPGGKFNLSGSMKGLGCLDVRPVIINGVVIIGDKKHPQKQIYNNQNYNGYI